MLRLLLPIEPEGEAGALAHLGLHRQGPAHKNSPRESHRMDQWKHHEELEEGDDTSFVKEALQKKKHHDKKGLAVDVPRSFKTRIHTKLWQGKHWRNATNMTITETVSS